MKLLLSIIILFFGGVFSTAQSIHVNQLNQDFASYLHPVVTVSADSVLNASEFTISLASLKKYCDSPNSCYEVSIIEEAYDLSDSLLWNPLVERIRTNLFDSIVALNKADYSIVLEEILIGSPPSDDEYQMIHACYNPRHAILIKDMSENIIGVYEVCFECGKSIVAFSRLEWVEGIPSAVYDVFSRYGLR